MLPWDDALSYMQRMAQDASNDALTFLKMTYNIGYQKILAEFGRQVTEKTFTTTLIPGQRANLVPPDLLFPKTLEIFDGSTVQPVTEVASDRTWGYMKSGNIQGRPTKYHYRPRFGLGGGVVELYPIPSSASYILNLVYEGNDKNLSNLLYNTGTIQLTAGDTAVVGTSTVFTSAMYGRYLVPQAGDADQMPYRIAGFTDTTHLTLESPYNGTGETGLSYKIQEFPNLPQDMHVMPPFYALEAWWSSKGNAQKQTEFAGKFLQAMQIAKKTHSGVTRDSIINPPTPDLPFPQYPLNYPTSIAAD